MPIIKQVITTVLTTVVVPVLGSGGITPPAGYEVFCTVDDEVVCTVDGEVLFVLES